MAANAAHTEVLKGRADKAFLDGADGGGPPGNSEGANEQPTHPRRGNGSGRLRRQSTAQLMATASEGEKAEYAREQAREAKMREKVRRLTLTLTLTLSLVP